MKTVAIMQPYFLPYIGYFQLIDAVDEFVVYDNIQFSKKGWIHRNRMLQNGKDEYFSLPLKKDSDFLDVNQRSLSESWETEKEKLLRKIKENYRKASNFDSTWVLVEDIFSCQETNLFDFVFNSLNLVCKHLGITTPLVISSSVSADHSLKGQERVLAICQALGADHYINPIGGLELYSNLDFKKENLELSFMKAQSIVYQQFKGEFVPWLSILDLLMFNELDIVRSWLKSYDLVKN